MDVNCLSCDLRAQTQHQGTSVPQTQPINQGSPLPVYRERRLPTACKYKPHCHLVTISLPVLKNALCEPTLLSLQILSVQF